MAKHVNRLFRLVLAIDMAGKIILCCQWRRCLAIPRSNFGVWTTMTHHHADDISLRGESTIQPLLWYMYIARFKLCYPPLTHVYNHGLSTLFYGPAELLVVQGKYRPRFVFALQVLCRPEDKFPTGLNRSYVKASVTKLDRGQISYMMNFPTGGQILQFFWSSPVPPVFSWLRHGHVSKMQFAPCTFKPMTQGATCGILNSSYSAEVFYSHFKFCFNDFIYPSLCWWNHHLVDD